MDSMVLRATEVRILLRYCRTDSYEAIKEIRANYPFSKKLKGSKVRIEDFAHAYDLKVEDIKKALQS